MRKPAAITVNLLPKDPFFTSPLGKFLQWALSIGRYIVIFTELIVIVSFASRFSLDRRITDLNLALYQKQQVIASYGTLEQDVRVIQQKIASYQQLHQKTDSTASFTALSAVTPPDVVLQSLTMKPDAVLLSGKTLSKNSLSLLINNLQLSPYFGEVVVDKIENKSEKDPGFEFAIQAQVTQGENGK